MRQVRFLHGAVFSSFGLSGTEVISDGLTTSFPAVNKTTFPGSIGTVADTLGRSGTNFCECICESEPSPIKTASLFTAAHNGNIRVSV